MGIFTLRVSFARSARLPVILGIGIDLMESARVGNELSRGQWQEGGSIFTTGETAVCNSSPQPARCFAGCFAAKEAATKALGIRVGDLASFSEVEVPAPDPGGGNLKFRRRLLGAAEKSGARHNHLSIAYAGIQTAAVVIIES
jgi:holo-[acyl-carrier protein] synthase